MNINDFINEIIAQKLDVEIYREKSVKSINTIRIGGIANCIIFVKNLKHFIFIIRKLTKIEIPFKIVGFGANILFADNYYNGIIIVTRLLDGYRVKEDRIICEGGLSLPRLSQIAINNCLSGLESFRIVPSTIAGAVFNNVACFEGDILSRVEQIIYLQNNIIKKVKGINVLRGYHESEFVGSDKIILKVVLRLNKSERQKIISKTNEFIKLKRVNQPLNEKSLGSVFKRGIDYFPAKLIEELGLKGFRIGDAEVSTKHSGFLINKDKCSFLDMKRLIAFIKEKVKAKYNISLQEEIEYFGR